LIRQNTLRIQVIQKIVIYIISFLITASLGSCGGGGGGDEGGPTPTPQYSISGGVTSGGSGLSGATMALTGAASASANSDSKGAYQFAGLSGGSYVITPSKEGYVFTPSSRLVTVTNANINGQDFTAALITWVKTFGGVNRDVAHSIQQTSDGGFIVAGETSSFGALTSHVWVLKLDVNGKILWEKVYGGVGRDRAHSIQQTSDGGYIVAGETSSFSFGGDTDVWVLKIKSDGDRDWQTTCGGSGDDIAYSIQQTSDGGYIVAGETASSGAGGADAFVFKLKSDGSIDWKKSYGGAGDDRARSIQQTPDGFIVAGETNSFGAGDLDVWVLKLDDSGAVSWQETFGGTKIDAAYSVQRTSDNGYIIAGGATLSGSIFNDVFLLKLDASGNTVQWQNTYGSGTNNISNNVAFSVQQTSDGGYIVAGKAASLGKILGDMWVLKLDSNGGVVWQKTYGGQGSNSANFVRQNLDGGYIVAGETLLGAGDADVWVLKLDGNGSIGSGCSIIGTPNASPAPAGFRPASTSVNGIDTNAIVNPTSVSPIGSMATISTQCSFP